MIPEERLRILEAIGPEHAELVRVYRMPRLIPEQTAPTVSASAPAAMKIAGTDITVKPGDKLSIGEHGFLINGEPVEPPVIQIHASFRSGRTDGALIAPMYGQLGDTGIIVQKGDHVLVTDLGVVVNGFFKPRRCPKCLHAPHLGDDCGAITTVGPCGCSGAPRCPGCKHPEHTSKPCAAMTPSLLTGNQTYQCPCLGLP